MKAVKRILFALLPLIVVIQTVIAKASDIGDCQFDGTLIFICDKNPRKNNCEIYRNHSIYGIQFRNCQMSELPPLNLDIYHRLHFPTLNITDMGLNTLNENVFNRFKHLQALFASHNDFKELPEGIFHSKPIERIDFSYNHFTEIESIGRLGAKDLYKLDLSNNNITHIRKNGFVNLTQLDELNLSNNHITLQNAANELDVSVFDHLKRLETLDMSWNKLSQIEFGMFVHLENLDNLNMAGNHLHRIDLSHLPPLGIAKLDISANDIDEIDGSLTYVFPYLTQLDLRNNSFKCSHLKSLLDESAASKLVLDSSAKLIQKKSYRGIECRPMVTEIKTQSANQQPTSHPDELKSTQRKDLLNEIYCQNLLRQNHDAMKTINVLLTVLVVILMVIIIGIVVYANRERLGASFQQKCVIRVRKSDLIDGDSEAIL